MKIFTQYGMIESNHLSHYQVFKSSTGENRIKIFLIGGQIVEWLYTGSVIELFDKMRKACTPPLKDIDTTE